MKILTVVGTRPEIIRLCRVVARLDELCDHTLVHTGQNFDANLKDVFFEELQVRDPDHYLGVKGTMGQQVGGILAAIEGILLEQRPDRVLILGDTNSCLSAIIAKRLAIPVFHMEAGNRCYDDRVPEEVNRRIIDHCSDVLMPYTERSRQNLLREGFAGQRVFVTGNPIFEVLEHFKDKIDASTIHHRLKLDRGKYFLVTMHRAENVDGESRLQALATALETLQRKYDLPVIVSTHPRTRNKMQQFGIADDHSGVRYLDPFGFFDFVALEKGCYCALTDSGTVQEECAILDKPNVTIRDVTERPETQEYGTNILAGADPELILTGVHQATTTSAARVAPPEYLRRNVSETVCNILLGYVHR